MIYFIIAIALSFAQTTTNENIIEYRYLQYENIRDATNNYENLRITYKLCEYLNETKTAIEQCQKHAYEYAISIDA